MLEARADSERAESKVAKDSEVTETLFVRDQLMPKCPEVEPRTESDHRPWVREILDRDDGVLGRFWLIPIVGSWMLGQYR